MSRVAFDEAQRAVLRGLELLDDDRQLFFALWCLDVLRWQASSYIGAQFSLFGRKQLDAAHEALWRCCLSDEAIRVVEMVEFVISEMPEPVEFGYPTFEELATFEFLEILRAAASCEDPLGLAKYCAVEILHFLDDDGDGKKKLAEVARQAVMVDYLVAGGPLSHALRTSTRNRSDLGVP